MTPRRAGVTALEGLLVVSLVATVLLAGVGVMSTTLRSWTTNTRRVDAENSTAYAARYIASRLQEACSATIAADGLSITFRLPAKDQSGNYSVPLVPETAARSFYVSGNRLFESGPTGTRELLTYVSSTDPSIPGSDKSYRVFQAGSGQVTRLVTVHLVTRRFGVEQSIPIWSRHRQVVVMRNVMSSY